MVSAAGKPSFDCLATVKRSFMQKGLSEPAATLAAHSRRESTFRVYGSRLCHWHQWCQQRGHDPNSAPMNVVGDFLTYLHGEKHLSPRTLEGYRTAIGTQHTGFEDGSTVSNNATLRRIIQGAFTLKPPVLKLVPSWSLTLVLRSLAEAPYEPMGDASLRSVTLKCAFLLALASARRCSQLAALSVHPDHLVWTRTGVRLSTKVGFLAKNQRLDYTPSPIDLKAMKHYSSIKEDAAWCPVRALKYYVKRTEGLRGEAQQLFIKQVQPHDGVRPVTIAGWIVAVIKQAYPHGQAPGLEQTPHAHDVRGISASWAKFQGVPIDEIMQAAAWKSPNTFISCYMKDIVESEGRFGVRVIAETARHTT